MVTRSKLKAGPEASGPRTDHHNVPTLPVPALEIPQMTEKQHANDAHLVNVAPVIDSTFSWADVKYGVGTHNKEKEILKGISGSLGGGKTCAIIGPSGAGKTSLLNVLANRINAKGKAQRVSGTIQLDGKPIGGAALRKRIAYVMQQDLLTPTQTPREAILFSAMLRLPAEVPLAEKAELVEKMLDDLGLMDCADTLIGDEMIRGISGGEKKRTSIGIELVMRPKLIFLDEPTSGLDAFAAHVIMKKVAVLAHSGGCNVLTTIHQPSSEVFHGFDKVMLLRKGEALFFGAPPQLSKGLAACGLGCPAEFNLADHALFVVQTEADEKISQLRATLPTAASRSRLAAEEGREVSPEPRTVAGASRAAGFTVQAVQLAKRELQGLWRNKPAFLATFIVPTVLNLFFALIFFQVGDTTKSNYEINSHFGGMTQIAIGGMFGSAQPLLLRFPLDRGIFLREYATSTYGALPYFLSKSLVELPTLFTIACLVYLVSYWLMALNGSWLLYVLVYWVAGLAAASTALLVGCLVPNAEVAQQMAPALFVPQLLFAGFFIRTAQIPEWLSWVQYLCGLKYGMNLFILNEFGKGTSEGWSTGAQAAAQAIVDNNDIEPDRWWVYLLILLVLICAFRLLAILALAKRAEAFF